MRIVILTDSSSRHFYLCNKIIEDTGSVVGIITGAKTIHKKTAEKILNTIKNHGVFRRLKNLILNVLFREYGARFQLEKKQAEDQYFGGSENVFNEKNAGLYIEKVKSEYRSINNEYYVSAIRALQPDIIVVMGTCLVGDAIISSAKHVINMHTGLSPYYRGGYTNLWPIIESDYGYFGVTIHIMTSGIDSGNIIYTIRPELDANDSYGVINCKCIILGIDAMVKTIKHIENDDISSIEQWENGKLFYNRDWNNYVAYKYFKNKKAYMSKYLELFNDDNGFEKIKLVHNGRLI